MTRLVVSGAAGRMGRQVLAAALADPTLEVTGGLVRPGSAAVGADLGALVGLGPCGALASANAAALLADGRAQVLIDFSRPAATAAYAPLTAAHGCAFLTGTTGLTPEQLATVHAQANRIPVLIAANTSVGLTALLDLLPALARALGPDYDLEIVETHHRHKADAPSGTALALAQALAEATEAPLDGRARFGREGRAPRQRGEIGIHAVRAGGAIGEHRVILANEGEHLEIVHRATSRQTYALGAVRAAAWLAGQPPGLYTMRDVLAS